MLGDVTRIVWKGSSAPTRFMCATYTCFFFNLAKYKIAPKLNLQLQKKNYYKKWKMPSVARFNFFLFYGYFYISLYILSFYYFYIFLNIKLSLSLNYNNQTIIVKIPKYPSGLIFFFSRVFQSFHCELTMRNDIFVPCQFLK